jgi:hypothetical protein
MGPADGLRTKLLDGCGLDASDWVRLVGPWPQEEAQLVFGGVEGVRVVVDEPEED